MFHERQTPLMGEQYSFRRGRPEFTAGCSTWNNGPREGTTKGRTTKSDLFHVERHLGAVEGEEPPSRVRESLRNVPRGTFVEGQEAVQWRFLRCPS